MKGRASKRILVTGGAGFVGSHLCEKLLGLGHRVVAVDNFFTGTMRNIQHLAAHPRFEMLRHDVIEPLPAPLAPPLSSGIDEIYNLACPASPAHYQYDPVFTMKTSVFGALNLLELARSSGARILQASTSEVYGDPEMHPQRESYWGNVNPTGLRACYDEGKRCAETLFFDYHRRHGIAIKVARIFNTYGPRMHQNDGRIVSNFVVQALTREPITVYGDGTQTRSFCYVSDLVDALIALMESGPSVTGPINLGNPAEVRVIDLARLVKTMTGSTSPIEFRPLPSDDPRRRRPDIEQAKALLDWAPRVDLQSGLRHTIRHFEGWLTQERRAPAAKPRAAGQGRAAQPAGASVPIA